MRRFLTPILGILFVLNPLAGGLFLPISANAAGTIAASVIGTTDTQAVLSYTAPDANPCTVKISESASLSPPDHDVDPALFPGSNMDNRPGALSSGATRIFVAGTRDTETGADGLNYSRALQQDTLHYYQITCGSSSANGTFTTAVEPLGDTYRDVPYFDQNHPGNTIIPTVTDDPNQAIIDPHFGTLIKKANTQEELWGTNYLALYSGGFVHICADTPSGPDPNGYLCAFWSGAGPLYYITAAGKSTSLGYVATGNVPGPNGWVNKWLGTPYISSDGHFYEDDNDNSGHWVLLKGTYVGNYQEVPPGTPANISWTNLTPYPNDIISQAEAFDPTFNPSNYSGYGDVQQVGGNYAMLYFRRTIQDTSGWYVIMDVTTGRVIAMLNAETGPAISFCGLHTSETAADQPVALLSFHAMWGGSPGSGPYTTTLAAPLDTSTTTIQLTNGNLTAPDGINLGMPEVNTVLRFISGNDEVVQVTGIVNSTTIQVKRAYIPPLIWPWDSPSNHQPATHAAGDTIRAECSDFNYGGGGPLYWKFLDDPHGQNANNGILYAVGTGVSGHDSVSDNLHVGEGWHLSIGPLVQGLNQPATNFVPVSPYFANAAGACDGSTCSQHPSYHAVGAQWFTDGLPWNGGTFTYNNAVTLISGQLYKYQFPYGDGNWLPPQRDIHRKQVPTLATSGGHPLTDVSGPDSRLSNQPSDSYKYCVAYKAGECEAGSNAGDMFANVPGIDRPTCYVSDNPNPGIRDVCITDMPGFGNGMVQIGFVANHEGLGILPNQPDTYDSSMIGAGYSRVVTEGLAGPKASSEIFKPLPDGSWGFFQVYSQQQYLMMAKIPRFVKDNVRRDIFVRSPLTLTPPANQGITQAEVEFGYAEEGPTGQFYCTSRREACVVTASTIDDTNPFSYEQSDSFSPVPCSSSCSITLPVAPEHAAYYHVKYLNASGAQVAEDFGVSAESAAVSLGGAVSQQPQNPPVISSLNVSNITGSSATIQWKTDAAADTTVNYGTTMAYGQSQANAAASTEHSLTLASLAPNTLYHFQAVSANANGSTVSPDTTFTTQSSSTPTSSPTMAILSITSTNITTSTAEIAWTTNLPGDSTVYFGQTLAYERNYVVSGQMVTTHDLILPSLLPNTLYHYKVQSSGVSSAIGSYDMTFTTAALGTPPPPALSITSAVGISPQSTGATLAWTTNNPASSLAFYGTSLPYSLSVNNGSLVSAHSVTLFSLAPGTNYHVSVESVDANGSLASSSDMTFQTTAAAAPPVSPSGGPVAPAAPLPVSSFSAAPGNGRIALAWTNPTDRTFLRVAIVRKQSPYPPSNPIDGREVYEGTAQEFTDTNLANGLPYSYALFTVTAGGYPDSPSARAVATPQGVNAAPAPSASASPPAGPAIKDRLYVGILGYGSEVSVLQQFLKQDGYATGSLPPGIFDAATEAALKRFQCLAGIVCRGAPATTGYGLTGPKTRVAINAILAGTAVAPHAAAPTLTAAQIAAIKALIQQLTAQVLQLEVQLLQMQARGQ